jgi:integrase
MNIKRDPNNRKTWMIDTTIKLPDGTFAHLKKKGYQTKMEAFIDFESVYADHVMKRGFKSSKESFNNLIEEYVKYKSQRVKISTMAGIQGIIRTHFESIFHGKCIKNVYTSYQLEKFRSHVISLPCSQRHRNKILFLMKELSEYAFTRGIIGTEMYRLSRLSTEAISGQETIQTSYHIWTKDQYRQFINTFDENDKYRVLFQWMFFSGARIGETIALQWKDFDSIKRTVFIYKTASARHGTGKTDILTTKTKSGIRKILLSNEMNQVLSDLKEAFCQNEEHFLFFGGISPIGSTPIRNKFFSHIRIANLPRIKIHEIRHTNNTWLLDDHQSRGEADIITKRLGRSSLKVTLDTYYHSNPEIENHIIEKLKI